jgi:site-specific DNA recombinase
MPKAAEVLRTLIEQIRLAPSAGKLAIDLRGDLAAILTFASDKKRPDILSEAGLLGDLLSPVSLVAGTRNTRCRHLEAAFYSRLVEREIPHMAA